MRRNNDGIIPGTPDTREGKRDGRRCGVDVERVAAEALGEPSNDAEEPWIPRCKNSHSRSKSAFFCDALEERIQRTRQLDRPLICAKLHVREVPRRADDHFGRACCFPRGVSKHLAAMDADNADDWRRGHVCAPALRCRWL